MANVTPVPNPLSDPGFLFWAPLGSTLPANTVVGSVFTDAWPVAWINLGATKEGSEFKYGSSFDGVEVAEFLLPIKQVTTGAEGGVSFALANYTAANLKKIYNGGALTVTGSTTTTLTKYTPPTPGSEVRAMIGWESLDATVRRVLYQTVNTATTSVGHKKGTDTASLPGEFTMEVPSSGVPWEEWTAGVARA